MTTPKPSERPGPGRPREFDPDDVVIDAIEVFRARGYHGTSVDDLTKGTGLARGSLYKAFRDKHSLFVAALERMYQELRDRQKDLSVRASDPVVAMEQLVHHTFFAFKDNPSAIRLMNEENKHRGKYIRKSGRMRAFPEIDKAVEKGPGLGADLKPVPEPTVRDLSVDCSAPIGVAATASILARA